ncbi:pyridoxamine 5'-phosphate oxidase family protein [Megasphaera sp.]|uniref:pyridoxamine 5'-phosphate oxidase family protein n=1 Tax=Megasphaera sp. TaxID=2023260 RepID=UPI003521D4DF
MKEVAAFLQHCKPFYLATMDGDKPQVRPFGALCEFEDKLYLSRRTKKPCIVR